MHLNSAGAQNQPGALFSFIVAVLQWKVLGVTPNCQWGLVNNNMYFDQRTAPTTIVNHAAASSCH